MAKKLSFLLLVCLLNITNTHAQNKGKELNINQKKEIIIFLINERQFDADTSEWKKYLDAIEYKQVYYSGNNELYTFSTTSFHALTYFLIKEGSRKMFLDSKYSKDNIDVLMKFFIRNSNSESKPLLKSISKVVDTYESNKISGSKIPVTPSKN